MNRKTLLYVLKYGASIAILAWLYYQHQGEFDQFLETDKQYGWLAIAGCTITLAFFLSYMRWHQLANAIHLKLSISDAAKLGFIGSFFNIVAFGVVGGDSLRTFYAVRHSPHRIPEAILSVFIDRFIGLMTMFGFAATAGYLVIGTSMTMPGQASDALAKIGYICQFAGIVMVIGTSSLLLFLFFPGIRKAVLFQRVQALPRIGPFFRRGIDAAAIYSTKKIVILRAVCLSLCTNLLFATTIFLVANAITDHPPKLSEHLVIAPISMVANSAPLPGGIGGMEAVLAILYRAFNAEGGLVVALGYRLCILLVSFVGLFVWLAYRSEIRSNDFGKMVSPG